MDGHVKKSISHSGHYSGDSTEKMTGDFHRFSPGLYTSVYG